MPRDITFYELSSKADQDICDIFDYTKAKFGLDQAVSYVGAFNECFYQLIENPELGRKRDEIREELRSISSDSHIVFYRIFKGRIRIVRILHSSRDLPKYFQ